MARQIMEGGIMTTQNLIYFLLGAFMTGLIIMMVSFYRTDNWQPVGTKTNGETLMWNEKTGNYK